jgi:glycosyltransferase involved in cell wall biosynthesis
VVDGATGYVIERNVDHVAAALRRFVELSPEVKAEMGSNARSAVKQYNEDRFVSKWSAFYDEFAVPEKQIEQEYTAKRLSM